MTNRAATRQKARELGKRKRHVAAQRPVGAHGFECDSVDGLIHCTFHMGEGAFTVAYDKQNIRQIARMMLDACDRDGTPAENIVEETGASGLVIARGIPEGM